MERSSGRIRLPNEMKKEEIIRQFEARGASKEIIDKIKNACDEEAVDVAWKQLVGLNECGDAGSGGSC